METFSPEAKTISNSLPQTQEEVAVVSHENHERNPRDVIDYYRRMHLLRNSGYTAAVGVVLGAGDVLTGGQYPLSRLGLGMGISAIGAIHDRQSRRIDMANAHKALGTEHELSEQVGASVEFYTSTKHERNPISNKFRKEAGVRTVLRWYPNEGDADTEQDQQMLRIADIANDYNKQYKKPITHIAVSATQIELLLSGELPDTDLEVTEKKLVFIHKDTQLKNKLLSKGKRDFSEDLVLVPLERLKTEVDTDDPRAFLQALIEKNPVLGAKLKVHDPSTPVGEQNTAKILRRFIEARLDDVSTERLVLDEDEHVRTKVKVHAQGRVRVTDHREPDVAWIDSRALHIGKTKLVKSFGCENVEELIELAQKIADTPGKPNAKQLQLLATVALIELKSPEAIFQKRQTSRAQTSEFDEPMLGTLHDEIVSGRVRARAHWADRAFKRMLLLGVFVSSTIGSAYILNSVDQAPELQDEPVLDQTEQTMAEVLAPVVMRMLQVSPEALNQKAYEAMVENSDTNSYRNGLVENIASGLGREVQVESWDLTSQQIIESFKGLDPAVQEALVRGLLEQGIIDNPNGDAQAGGLNEEEIAQLLVEFTQGDTELARELEWQLGQLLEGSEHFVTFEEDYAYLPLNRTKEIFEQQVLWEIESTTHPPLIISEPRDQLSMDPDGGSGYFPYLEQEAGLLDLESARPISSYESIGSLEDIDVRAPGAVILTRTFTETDEYSMILDKTLPMVPGYRLAAMEMYDANTGERMHWDEEDLDGAFISEREDGTAILSYEDVENARVRLLYQPVGDNTYELHKTEICNQECEQVSDASGIATGIESLDDVSNYTLDPIDGSPRTGEDSYETDDHEVVAINDLAKAGEVNMLGAAMLALSAPETRGVVVTLQDKNGDGVLTMGERSLMAVTDDGEYVDFTEDMTVMEPKNEPSSQADDAMARFAILAGGLTIGYLGWRLRGPAKRHLQSRREIRKDLARQMAAKKYQQQTKEERAYLELVIDAANHTLWSPDETFRASKAGILNEQETQLKTLGDILIRTRKRDRKRLEALVEKNAPGDVRGVFDLAQQLAN